MFAIQSTGWYTGSVTVFDVRFATRKAAEKVCDRVKSIGTSNRIEVVEVVA